MILLTLSHIYKSFVMNRVLTDVNLTLAEGSRMGLVGVNGSGKSTLFQIIAGVLKPDEGTVSMISAIASESNGESEDVNYTVYVDFTPDDNTRYGMSAVITTMDEMEEEVAADAAE